MRTEEEKIASFGKRIQRSDEPLKPDRRTGARNQGDAGEGCLLSGDLGTGVGSECGIEQLQ